MAQQDALQSILAEVGHALAPFRTVDSPARATAFFRQLGYEIPPGNFGSGLTELATHTGEIVAAAQRLVATTPGNEEVAAAILDMMGRLSLIIAAAKKLESEIVAGGGGAIPDIDDLPRRLVDFLLLDYLESEKAQLHEALHLIGLIEHDPVAGSGQPVRLINWDRFGMMLSNPSAIFDTVYQWNTAFDDAEFLSRLDKLMRATFLPGGLYDQPESTRTLLGNTSPGLKELRFPLLQAGLTEATYSQFGITFSPAEAQGGKKRGIALLPYLMGAAAFDFAVCERGQLLFSATADIKGVGLVVRPPFEAEGILNLAGGFQAAVEIRQHPNHAPELILIGTGGGTRLAVQGLGITWFTRSVSNQLDVGFEGQIQALRLVIAPGEGDGFLAQLLSGLNVATEAELGFGYSLLSGFYVTGGAKFAIEIPTHVELGPVKILSAKLALLIADEKLRLEAGANFRFDLGPLQATVENIGMGVDMYFRAGNAGPLDLVVGFKPPNGVGLSVDAGVVKGGGYLYFDFENEEYAGALELVFSGFITLKAIGLITTRMPDGSKGFSLLIIITAEFGTGFQLGFGFVLLGVGGLLGLNRTMKLEALAQGIRTGTAQNILFPTDVIANAPRIISDLRTVFPPENGRFLIGPMAKIGWGTPALITLSLGIIIEIPGNIAILGVLKVALPTEAAPLVILQVSFIGAIEFDKKRIWFFATLFGSRVLFFTLEGEMGILMAFGDDANFVLSVGGFHPSFTPPPLPFPSPRRIAFDIANTPTYAIRVEGYFAITSNTVQFGARAELRIGMSNFGVSGHIAFDALFQFSPFYFIITISASVSLKAFGVGLFSIRLNFELSGPEPWRAKGSGSLELLFFSIEADFDITWGEDRRETLQPVSSLELLTTELNKLENWTAELAGANRLLVSLRKMDESEGLVLHPVGVLRFTQRAVPIGISLDKIGAPAVKDYSRFNFASAAGSAWGKVGDPRENFAIAQFQNLSDAEKLSRPSFQQEVSGAELSVAGTTTRTGFMTKRTVRYEQIVIDTNYRRFARRLVGYFGSLFNQFLRGNAVALSPLSRESKRQFDPLEEKLAVLPEGFGVVTTVDNSPVTNLFASEAEAREYLHLRIADNPNAAVMLDVVPEFEVNLN
ncbi:DUF6603 domain-containing protein [Neolewinella litorea]|uniref:DUF6603 domain-containing protein n=1 Tax=Neolewinella litorea TaxID=2562452 RepID=A0A4S4NHP4_9BACT|nr:DUF6603 domain-containing protein [Neolewinella litorea]THH35620.1 hypothetical protein E4021_16160 [Neolewinella litorea]